MINDACRFHKGTRKYHPSVEFASCKHRREPQAHGSIDELSPCFGDTNVWAPARGQAQLQQHRCILRNTRDVVDSGAQTLPLNDPEFPRL